MAYIIREYLSDGTVSDNGYYEKAEMLMDLEEFKSGSNKFEVIPCTDDDVRYGLNHADRYTAIAVDKAHKLGVYDALIHAGYGMELYYDSMMKASREYENAVRNEMDDFVIDCAEREADAHDKMYRESQQTAEEAINNAVSLGMTRNDCLLVIAVGQNMYN